MIALPPSLAPWSSALRLFSPDLGVALGRLVQRIAWAVDPIHSMEWDRQGDPDGFNGLANRGPYDRLIATDWLLANEIPEEFDRRAAMNEHLFLHQARRNPAQGLGSFVLFDAGPDQIGSPRIAHLALAIVLQRRAAQANASFSWGALQAPDTAIHSLSSSTEITLLLQARTRATPTAAQVKEWTQLALATHEPDEVWLVGGSQLRTMDVDARLPRIFVEDILDPNVRRLVVEVRRPSSAPRRVLLDLPENGLCARLLRDPFENRTASTEGTSKRSPQSNLVWAASGRRVLAAAGEGFLLSASVPNAPQTIPARPKYHFVGTGGPIVGANFLNKTTVAVLLEGNALRVAQIGKSSIQRAGSYPLDAEFVWPTRAPQRLLPCCGTVKGQKRWMLLVLDASGTLFSLSTSEAVTTVRREAEQVLALTQRGQALSYVRHAHNGTQLVTVGGDSVIVSDADPNKVFLGFSADAKGSVPLLALELNEQTWQINPGTLIREVRISRSEQVMGVIQEPSYEPALVTLRDGHRLCLKAATWDRTLIESVDPIVDVAVSPMTASIAYVTQTGTLAVYSLTMQKELCRYTRQHE